MAHLIRHLPPRWEFVRTEPLKDKKRREIAAKQLAEINKTRSKQSCMWWEEQRHVDQVVPSHFVNPDLLDTFHYRYQVYARPSIVQCPPICLADVTDRGPPIRYNVKRIAVDKMWAPGGLNCAHHWSKHPWEAKCCLPVISDNADEDCSKNNSARSMKSPSPPCHIDAERHPHLPQIYAKGKENDDERRRGCMDTENRPGGTPDLHGLSRTNVCQEDLNLRKQKHSADGRSCNSSTTCTASCMSVHGDPPVLNLNNNRPTCGSQILHNKAHAAVLSNKNERPLNNRTETGQTSSIVVGCDQSRPNSDTVASLIYNNNSNNTRADTTPESCIFFDNLIGTDEQIIDSVYTDTSGISAHEETNSNLVSRDENGHIVLLLLAHQMGQRDYLYQNNNACVYDENGRPQCVPGRYGKSFCLTPEQPQTKINTRAHEQSRRSRMELLGHLQGHVKPICFRGKETLNMSDSCRLQVIDADDKKMVDMGYMSYKIIGGKQYRLPPPKNYLSELKLPPELEEYREFTRRCPNPTVGRYDQADPANELLLPGHSAALTIPASRNPFVYTRNPRCYSYPPLFYPPRVEDDLCWNLPSFTVTQ